MSEIFPDRAEWFAAFQEIARRRAPVPSASVEPEITPLRPRTARKAPKIEQSATARPCSRCHDEPRAGSSGWGKRCIAEKMRDLRAARRSVNTTVGQTLLTPAQGAQISRRTEEIMNAARARAAARAARTTEIAS